MSFEEKIKELEARIQALETRLNNIQNPCLSPYMPYMPYTPYTNPGIPPIPVYPGPYIVTSL